MERRASRGEREPRRAVAQRREGGRIRAGEPGLGGEGEGQQVRHPSALRPECRGLHRAARARVPRGVPQYQDPGVAVTIRAKLSTTMFLQFFICGAWYTTIGNYMSAHGMAKLAYLPYTVNPVAAILAPF